MVSLNEVSSVIGFLYPDGGWEGQLFGLRSPFSSPCPMTRSSTEMGKSFQPSVDKHRCAWSVGRLMVPFLPDT